jgi:hypothetical protein
MVLIGPGSVVIGQFESKKQSVKDLSFVRQCEPGARATAILDVERLGFAPFSDTLLIVGVVRIANHMA